MTPELRLDDFGFKAAVEAGREAHRRLDYMTSARCFARAAQLQRTQFVLTMWGAASRQMGDIEGAIRLYREALALPGPGKHAATGLIRAMCLAGEPVQALELAAATVVLHPDDRALLTTIRAGLPEAERAVADLLPEGVPLTPAHLAPIRQLESVLAARLSLLDSPPSRDTGRSDDLYMQAVAGAGGKSRAPFSEASPREAAAPIEPKVHSRSAVTPQQALASDVAHPMPIPLRASSAPFRCIQSRGRAPWSGPGVLAV